MLEVHGHDVRATLVASDGETADWFGCSVAVSGDTIVVGAYGDDVGGMNNQGSVYVFTRRPRGGPERSTSPG